MLGTFVSSRFNLGFLSNSTCREMPRNHGIFHAFYARGIPKNSNGLRKSPVGFLAFLCEILRDNMSANLSIYMDDCIIFHSNFEEHVSFLGKIIEKLRKAKLRINPKKSLFVRNSLVFLGFLFTPEGIGIDLMQFEKIRNLKPARNVKDVKILISFTQYWRKFCRGFSHMIQPLRRLLQKNVNFEWGPDQDKASET
jgi:hypothetical protein